MIDKLVYLSGISLQVVGFIYHDSSVFWTGVIVTIGGFVCMTINAHKPKEPPHDSSNSL